MKSIKQILEGAAVDSITVKNLRHEALAVALAGIRDDCASPDAENDQEDDWYHDEKGVAELPAAETMEGKNQSKETVNQGGSLL